MHTPFHSSAHGTLYFQVPSICHQLLYTAVDIKKILKKTNQGILIPRIFVSQVFQSTYSGEFGGRSAETSLLATLSRIFTPAADEHGDTTWRFNQEQLFVPLSATLRLLVHGHTVASRKNRNDFVWKKRHQPARTPGRMFPGMIRDRRN